MKNHITLISLIFIAFLSSCGQRSKFNPKEEPLIDSYKLPQELQYKPDAKTTENVDVKTKKPEDDVKTKKPEDDIKTKKPEDDVKTKKPTKELKTAKKVSTQEKSK